MSAAWPRIWGASAMNSASTEPAAARLAASASWDAEADDALVCLAVRQETHDVKTFVLSPLSPGASPTRRASS